MKRSSTPVHGKWLRPLQRGLLLGLLTGVSGALAQTTLCATPGKDGVGTNLTGTVNTYYPGNATANAGANSISVGTSTGASAAITTGDLLLVIQMQDAALNTGNDELYGDGSGTANNVTGNGSGATSIGAGKYEYVVARSAVSGGSVTVAGTGTGGGLLNSYSASAYSGASGQKTFQVIRVPQYSSATLGTKLTAPAWNGSTGGVVAIDVSGTLSLNGGSIDVAGLGFRGGAGRSLAGASTASNTDYRNLSTLNAHAQKGEGVAGTPRYPNNNGVLLDTAAEGYPNGSSAQGAPGNAGGGGTDGNAAANDQNTGGGGGANGGAGGRGGNAWSTSRTTGGYGGASITPGAARLLMGGGGGAGSTNNATGTPGNGLASSGAAGGGLVFVRTGTLSGSGSITANGADANTTVMNDGSGGGGAGGSVMVLAQGALPASLSISARGGNGGTNTGGGSPHGPGGGGGGGSVALSGSGPAVTVTGGVNGTTAGTPAAFGATSGANGQTLTVTGRDVPGARATASCSADLAIDKSGPAAVGSAQTMSYILRVWNNGPNAISGVGVNDTVPSGFTVTGISCAVTGTTATCGTQTFTGTSITVTTGNLTLDTAPTNATPDGNFLTYTITGTAPANGSLSNTASLTVPAGTVDGVTANNTSAAVSTRIVDAVNDPAVTYNFGSGGTVSVLTNDTNGGAAATAANSVVTVTSDGGLAGLTVNASDQIVVPTTAPVGTYNVTYRLCDSVEATACDTATVSITVVGGAGGTVPCNASFYQLRQDPVTALSNLYQLNPATPSAGGTPLWTSGFNPALNALGYNPRDNFFYAVNITPLTSGDPFRLYRLGMGGAEEYAPLTGLPGGSTMAAGAVDRNGVMYLKKVQQDTVIYRYDIANKTLLSALAVPSLTMYDFAINPADNLLYGVVAPGVVYQINPMTGATVTRGTVPTINATNAIGSAFFDTSGTLYGYQNSGVFGTIEISSGAFTQTGTPGSATQSDGGSCAFGPSPVVTLLKLGRNVSTSPAQPFIGSSGSIGAKPGDTVEYCIVYNNAGGTAFNFKLTDNVPAGMNAVTDGYVAGRGVRWADGTVIATGAAAAPAGSDLTSINTDGDKGSLTLTDGLGKGVMTLDLGTAGLAAGSKGTVCFQAKVP